MTGGNDQTNKKVPQLTPIKIYGTSPDEPEDGRIFIRTKAGWFERLIEDQSKDLIFTQVGQSENEFLRFVAKDAPSINLVQLSGEYRQKVYDELMKYLTPDSKFPFAKELKGKSGLFTITGMALIILGLLIFGMGIYFRLAYSPVNFSSSGYPFLYRQVYSGGLAAIIVGAIMDIFGWIILALASIGKR
jgi:hypothetical protein